MIKRITNGRPEALEHLLVSLSPSSSDNNAIRLDESSVREAYSLHFILVHSLHIQLGNGSATS